MGEKSIVPLQQDTKIRAEAATWIAQLDRGDFTDADRLALREWAKRSPRHVAELRSLAGMWSDIDDCLSGIAAEQMTAGPTFKEFIGSTVHLRPMSVYSAGATLCAAMFMCVAVLVSAISTFDRTYQATYTVAQGEQRLITLPDDSTVHLNTDSLIQVEMREDQRIVRLLRGEAHFNVAHDSSRPFFVEANGSVVRAVGTAFVVRINDDETSVIVTEGVVEFSQVATFDPQRDNLEPPADILLATLQAGQKAKASLANLTERPTVTDVSEEDIDRRLAWRDGLLVFDGESLDHVVREVSRYTSSRIVITDPQLRDLPIGGSFKAGEVEALLVALKASFEISIAHEEGDLIYIASRRSE